MKFILAMMVAKIVKSPRSAIVALLLMPIVIAMPIAAQESSDPSSASSYKSSPDLTGTWSDPPPRAEDAFCHIGCLIEAREYLTNLLNDIENIDRSFADLKDQAQRYQITELLPGYMTPQALEARKNRGRPPASASCEPWGLVRTALAPHALQLTQYEDHIVLFTSEWTVMRHVHMDGREFPDNLEPSKYGYSIGRYEGEELVVETRGLISDHFGAGGFRHSNQAKITERFRRVGEDRLEVEVVLTDPLTYTQPLRMARAWAWAPGEEIYPYDNCVIPE